MYGESDINHMSLDELHTLESNLEIWVQNIRFQKVRFMLFQYRWKFSVKGSCNLQSCNILPLYGYQMQTLSREIEMLRNQVGSACTFLVPVTNLSLHIQETNSAVPFTNVLQEGILQAANDMLQERVLLNSNVPAP
jgi:hypothetical protein